MPFIGRFRGKLNNEGGNASPQTPRATDADEAGGGPWLALVTPKVAVQLSLRLAQGGTVSLLASGETVVNPRRLRSSCTGPLLRSSLACGCSCCLVPRGTAGGESACMTEQKSSPASASQPDPVASDRSWRTPFHRGMIRGSINRRALFRPRYPSDRIHPRPSTWMARTESYRPSGRSPYLLLLHRPVNVENSPIGWLNFAACFLAALTTGP